MNRVAPFIFALISHPIFGFIAPVPDIVHEIFFRRPQGAVEVSLRHRVTPGNGTAVEFDEQIITDRGGRSFFIFKGGPFPLPLQATFANQGYRFGGDQTIPSRSSLFARYFTSSTGDDFLNALQQEQFARRDQLLQFKPSFTAEGDPKAWDLKENTLRHDDIFLKKFGAAVTVAVVGLEDATSRRAIYFEKRNRIEKGDERLYLGVRRLEWKDGVELAAWNFDRFMPVVGGGLYARQMFFELNGLTLITTQVIGIRTITDKAVLQLRQTVRQSSLSPSAEGILKIVLGYR